MSQFLLFALLGLGSGAIIATVALGLVLMHRASGVINFAHGALAMYAIYVYLSLRDQGRLILPIPAVGAIGLGGTLGFAPAFAIAVLSTAAMGALVYLLVFRFLESAPVLAQIVATVGLLLAISGLVQLHFPSELSAPLYAPQVLPTDNVVSIAGVSVQADQFVLCGLAIFATGVLAAVYRYTTFGLATRAAAASPKGVQMIGRDPRLIALGNWVLAGALAGVFGVLVAPLISIAPNDVVLLVVPSLAAAMLAGFRSFWVACFTGLAIGVAQSELVNLQANHPSLPQGLEAVAPLIVIIAVAFVRGHTTLRRDDPAQDRLPRSPRPVHPGRAALVCLILGALALGLTSGDVRLGLIVSLISAVVCLSMVLVTGYLGQVSLMQLTFAGMGGLLVSALVAKAGVPFPLAPLLALVGAGALGLLVGVPALRVRGTSLAVVTLSAAVVAEQLIFPSSVLSGGVQGNAVRAPTILGVNFNILSGAYPGLPFALLVLVFATLAAAGVANLRRSPSGVRLLAIRANERAAASSGINLAQTKLVAFTLAALLAGLAGVLFAYQQVRLSTGSFGVFPSLLFLAFAYLGGITSVSGAMIAGLLIPGGLVLTLLGKLGDVGQYQSVAVGVLVMAIAVGRPDGLAGLLAMPRDRRRGARVERTAAPEDRGAGQQAADLGARLAEASKR